MKSYENYYLAKRNLLANANLRTRVCGELKPGSRIHVSAACGKAMASITCMLKESGYQVTASDVSFEPPMSDVLVSHRIACLPPSEENLQNIDLLVPGNMLPPSALEVVYARAQGIPMLSGSEVLRDLLTQNKRSLVVAGTHGKTTTSSLLAHVFMKSEKSPAYMIGGSFQDTGESYSVGSANATHAIFEGDEYDCAYFDKAPKFLRYNTSSAIITSIEHDHVDLYPTFEDYKQAFQFLVEDAPARGYLVVHESALEHIDISSCLGQVFTYGKTAQNDFSYTIQSVSVSSTIFSIHTKDRTYADIRIPLFGEYNVANATSVFALALLEGVEVTAIISALATYPGVHERQEVLGISKNITVIRDFAHHPTAVRVTLDGLKSHYPNSRIVCVFEPRSITSRKKVFERVYPESLKSADVSILVSPPFKENDTKSDFMNVSVVATALEILGKRAFVADSPAIALQTVSEHVTEGDVIIFMSNGDFGGIPEKFLNNL